MKRFGNFLGEALAIIFKAEDQMVSEGVLINEGPAPAGAQLFHKDIGIPTGVSGPPAGLRLTYSSHAKRAALDDRLTRVPATLPAIFTVIEVEVVNKRPTKWVVRIPAAPNEQRDLILVVQPDGFVRTIWTNDKNDTHKTLKRWLYTPPGQYR
jgi:hypothetical protein